MRTKQKNWEKCLVMIMQDMGPFMANIRGDGPWMMAGPVSDLHLDVQLGRWSSMCAHRIRLMEGWR